METKKVAKEYLQKDILRTIYQMRKWKEDDKQIKRILVLDYDLTEYYWKSNIKKLQEEHSVILRVKKSQNCFLLKTKKDESIGYVWYRRDDEWIARVPDMRMQIQTQADL